MSMEALRDLGASICADALRDLGERARTASPGIRPVVREHVCAGPARTARFEVVPPEDADFLPLAAFIDSCQPGEVLVLSAAPGASPGSVWGEICSAAATARGAAGVVIDGYMRDEVELARTELPLFSRGPYAQDCLGRSMVTATNVTVDLGGVRVEPGDPVVADVNGVVVVPAAMLGAVIDEGGRKQRAEEALLEAARTGRSLREAVERAGTL